MVEVALVDQRSTVFIYPFLIEAINVVVHDLLRGHPPPRTMTSVDAASLVVTVCLLFYLGWIGSDGGTKISKGCLWSLALYFFTFVIAVVMIISFYGANLISAWVGGALIGTILCCPLAAFLGFAGAMAARRYFRGNRRIAANE